MTICTHAHRTGGWGADGRYRSTCDDCGADTTDEREGAEAGALARERSQSSFMTRRQAIEQLAEMRSDDARGARAAWLLTRPETVQSLAARCPPDTFYRVRPGAPYSLSSPGSICSVYSYREDGEVTVIVLRTTAAIDVPVRCQVDPQWLEPVDVDEAFPVTAEPN